MDQRRFISFLILSLGIFLLANQLFPPPKRPNQPAAAPAAKNDGKAGKADQKAAPLAGDAKKNEKNEKPEAPAQAGAQPAAQPPAQPGALPAIAATNVPSQFISLGSLDIASGYRMLVTLTNTGAAVTRAEMASLRYRDADDWSGYLGELELKKAADGVQVQVVGPGTPAAAAKIEVGDVIVGIGNPQSAAIKTPADFTRALSKTNPNQQIVLQVRHGNSPPEARSVQLIRRPFAVVRPEIENYHMRDVAVPDNFVDRPSFLLTLASLNGKELEKDDAKRLAGILETGNWELTAHDEKSATFKRTLPELKLEIVKRYTLAMVPPKEITNPDYPAYHLQLDVDVRNTAPAAPAAPAGAAGAAANTKPAVAYRLDGATGMPLEGWWFARKVSRHWTGNSLRDVTVRFVGSSVTEIQNSQIAQGKVEPMGDSQTLAYAGVDGQYFSAMLIPQLTALNDPWIETTEAVIVDAKADQQTAIWSNATCRLTRSAVSLDGGAAQHDSFRIFLGPKRPDLLGEYYPKGSQWTGDPEYSLRDLIYFGWFGSIARGMLAVLHFFYSIVGNYGIAIILLTVLVRGLLFPISYKQTQNMAKIQALKPEMDRINEKYKNDMQKKSQATQELYRKHNINPLGGCLPVFLQMPVLIGLYRALMVDVELRQSPLISHAVRWCSNLAAPDMLFDWSGFMPAWVNNGMGLTGFPLGGLLGLGPYLNVLPLITVVFFLVTQRMSMTAPANEQAAMQQKMMKYMTIFMGFAFYKVASGLCLYFIASSAWGIGERKLLPKAQTADAGAPGDGGLGVTSGGKRPRGDGSNGSSGTKRPRKTKPKK